MELLVRSCIRRSFTFVRRCSTVRHLSHASTEATGRRLNDADKQRVIDRIIRVDQAGEFAAVRIYQGQIDVLGKTPVGPLLKEMRENEMGHLRALNKLIPQRRVRPTALMPLWDAAAYALGFGTAMLGKEAAMACTVAVEEVITEHYNDQLRELHTDKFKDETTLREIIKKHRDDEIHHRDVGLENDAKKAPLYGLVQKVVKTGCKAAIWVSERI